MKKQILTIAALAIGFLAGASALSALAQTGTWTAPTSAPPGGNVSAPLNVGSGVQAKTGLLGLSSLQFNPGGASNVISGSVLTAMDNYGTVGWAASAGGYAVSIVEGAGSYSNTFACRINSSTGETTCKQSATSPINNPTVSWTSAASPFSASATGSYVLSCISGASGYNKPTCCRTNTADGSALCKFAPNTNLDSWTAFTTPF